MAPWQDRIRDAPRWWPGQSPFLAAFHPEPLGVAAPQRARKTGDRRLHHAGQVIADGSQVDSVPVSPD